MQVTRLRKHSELETTIRLVNNSAAFGGGIYIDDEGSPLACTPSDSPLSGLENECFFQAQVLQVFSYVKYVYFKINKATHGGTDMVACLIDVPRANYTHTSHSMA